MKILITGVNGFIGRSLAITLLDRGHSVIGLGKNKRSTISNITKYYSGSILDKKTVSKAMKEVEIVVHLAALTSHKEIINNKFVTLETNLTGTKNILEVFVKSKKAKKFLYSSTGKVYGKIVHLPIEEKHPTEPLSVLGKSKLITEKLVDFYNDNQKEFIILRIFNIYGPSQKNSFLIPTILNQIVKGETELTLGDVEAKRDYVYIDDLINAFVLAIEKKGNRGMTFYNICTGIGSSASDIVKIVSNLKNIKLTIKSNAALQRPDEMKAEYGSYEAIKKSLGWEPKYILKEGLKKIVH